MASGLYLDRLAVYDASSCPAESPCTPTRLQHNAAFQWEANNSSAPFATASTIDSCAHYLEPVLRDLGLKQWQLSNADPAAALNSLYELVQRHQDLAHSKQQMEEEMQKLKFDVKTADKNIQRLQCQSEQKAQEAGGLNIKLRQLDAWYREEAERWNGEREQMSKTCAQLQQRHAQFQHELRRKDTEFEKLQKQLASCLSGGKRGHGSSSSIAAGGKITTSSRAGTFTNISRTSSSTTSDSRRQSKAELEDIHKRVVEAYEADKEELLQECSALRKALHSLESEHKQLLNKVETGPPVSRTGQSSQGSLPSADACSSELQDLQAAAADPTGTLQQMQARLGALRLRKQRITGSGLAMGLDELQQHANSPSERLLMAKLLEAGKVMEEQETALVMALKALPHARRRA